MGPKRPVTNVWGVRIERETIPFVARFARYLETRVALDIANPMDPIDLSIRILNQVVAMERDEALHRPRWCVRSKSCDLL